MTEFPAVQRFLAEKTHEYILDILEARFGEVPKEIASHLKRIQKKSRLRDLHRFAVTCTDLQAFKNHLRG